MKGTHPLLNYHNGKNALNQLRVIFKPFELKLSFPDAIREMKKYSEEQVVMSKKHFFVNDHYQASGVHLYGKLLALPTYIRPGPNVMKLMASIREY